MRRRRREAVRPDHDAVVVLLKRDHISQRHSKTQIGFGIIVVFAHPSRFRQQEVCQVMSVQGLNGVSVDEVGIRVLGSVVGIATVGCIVGRQSHSDLIARPHFEDRIQHLVQQPTSILRRTLVLIRT